MSSTILSSKYSLAIVSICIIIVILLLYIYYYKRMITSRIMEGASGADTCSNTGPSISVLSYTMPPSTPSSVSEGVDWTELTNYYNDASSMGFMLTNAELASMQGKISKVHDLMSQINALLPETTQNIVIDTNNVTLIDFEDGVQDPSLVNIVIYNTPTPAIDASDVFHKYGSAQWNIVAQLPMLPPGNSGIPGQRGSMGEQGKDGVPGPPGARGPWGGSYIQ